MEQYLPFLYVHPLFRGLAEEETLGLLHKMHALTRHYDKAQILWDLAKQTSFFGIVLEGSMLFAQEDWKGNRTIIGLFGAGDLLGENLSRSVEGLRHCQLHVRSKTTILALDSTILRTPGSTPHVQTLLLNLNGLQVERELLLLQKINYLGKRSTREKLLAYLAAQATRQGRREVVVPFTRQELADYLAVDRSAMCTELTHMQNDGLLRCDRHYFELLFSVPESS
ncbi:MAG: Crp/Fnr family transcriptional regulator [Oscillospiraceae bacterium]|nr:Crp/Fnr family transcriptional regulator [Oscillospiraceae bacterium]